MGSPRFKLNWPDIGKVLLFALMVGLAAAITYIVDHVAQLDLGSVQGLVVAGLATVLELIRRWMQNNQTPPQAKTRRQVT